MKAAGDTWVTHSAFIIIGLKLSKTPNNLEGLNQLILHTGIQVKNNISCLAYNLNYPWNGSLETSDVMTEAVRGHLVDYSCQTLCTGNMCDPPAQAQFKDSFNYPSGRVTLSDLHLVVHDLKEEDSCKFKVTSETFSDLCSDEYRNVSVLDPQSYSDIYPQFITATSKRILHHGKVYSNDTCDGFWS